MFDDHQGCAAPLAAEADTLDDPQQDEKDGRKDADGGIVWQEADAEGAQAHDEHGHHKHGLASKTVAEMPE